MDGRWLPDNPDRLATDADLRQLQLRWLRDDLVMRRIRFAMTIATPVVGALGFAISPEAAIIGGATTGSTALMTWIHTVRRRI
jgi:hypothetical protein